MGVPGGVQNDRFLTHFGTPFLTPFGRSGPEMTHFTGVIWVVLAGGLRRGSKKGSDLDPFLTPFLTPFAGVARYGCKGPFTLTRTHSTGPVWPGVPKGPKRGQKGGPK